MSMTPMQRGKVLVEAMTHASAANDQLQHLDLRECPKAVREAVKEGRELATQTAAKVQEALQAHLEAQRESA